ncbi:MAG: hypothetical protein C5B44_02315 [Acidobacteria bacterium]|nr:MAG: hypothetical protein C5B44_02315 [Acidobacteriota bacterium]
MRSTTARTRRQKQQLQSQNSLSERDRKLLIRVNPEIHHNDGMYEGDGRAYFSVGLSAIRCLDRALDAAHLSGIQRVLDMPCGHGRVLRFMVHRFPQAKFVACDLDRGAVDYCVKTFAAQGAYSQPDLDRLTLPNHFDLIWCGSLITHLDAPRIVKLLFFFLRHLAPGGLLVFTTAGDQVLQWMTSGQFDYGIDERKIPLICADYRAGGYGYIDYPYIADYGISLTSPEWVRTKVHEIGSLREVSFEPHGWDNHQDVFGFVRKQ